MLGKALHAVEVVTFDYPCESLIFSSYFFSFKLLALFVFRFSIISFS